MSERKVLQKYFPPDFNPADIKRVKGPKTSGPKVQPVRLMAPFSMQCTKCGEFIYKGRKFNARKETTDEKYLNITIYRFYIRCTRCSAEITFKTDPKGMDYTCERGAKRNFEAWRAADSKVETDEERLDRLEAEEAAQDAMGALEEKMHDANTEMQIADALDEIRTKNARIARAEQEGLGVQLAGPQEHQDTERERQEREDEEAAKAAFRRRNNEVREAVRGGKQQELRGGEAVSEENDTTVTGTSLDTANAANSADATAMPPPLSFKKGIKRKKDFSSALGIKKKPALV